MDLTRNRLEATTLGSRILAPTTSTWDVCEFANPGIKFDQLLTKIMTDPIAAVDHKGEALITMEKGKHGLVNTATVASQLLYEIQGPLYYNSDVTASIEANGNAVGGNAMLLMC